MPSIITHAVVGIAAGMAVSKEPAPKRFWALTIFAAILPDFDVLGLKIGISYHSFWGHRGFSHSFLCAIVLGILIASIFFRKEGFLSKSWLFHAVYFSAIVASHGILDALTNGGGGVALLSPFYNERYSFWFRPIDVSPLSIKVFLGERGISVLKNEFLWVWLPSAVVAMVGRVAYSRKKTQNKTKAILPKG